MPAYGRWRWSRRRKASWFSASARALPAWYTRDVEAVAEHIVKVFHLNPASHTPRVFLDLAEHLTSSRLQLLALGAAAYASLHLVQAYGLWRGRRWAEWLTVVAGGIYIPVELYELWKSVTWPKLSLLAVI